MRRHDARHALLSSVDSSTTPRGANYQPADPDGGAVHAGRQSGHHARIISPTLGRVARQTVVVDNAVAAAQRRAHVSRRRRPRLNPVMGSSGPLRVHPVVTPNLPTTRQGILTRLEVPYSTLALAGRNPALHIEKHRSSGGKAAPASAGASPNRTTNHFGIELFSALVASRSCTSRTKAPSRPPNSGGTGRTCRPVGRLHRLNRDGRCGRSPSPARIAHPSAWCARHEWGLRARGRLHRAATAGHARPVSSKLHSAGQGDGKPLVRRLSGLGPTGLELAKKSAS